MNSFFFIVPTLNSYELLPRLVNSLNSQTYSNWRVLFVDGPSLPPHRNWLINLCESDSKFSFILQQPQYLGIFGAMNQGLTFAYPNDWVLFWGSDDWAASDNILFDLDQRLRSFTPDNLPDLLVCSGLYYDPIASSFTRKACFRSHNKSTSSDFRSLLFYGNTPPHQATVFGPSARSKLLFYNDRFRLAADLAYFLRLSTFSSTRVDTCDSDIVIMSQGGISGRLTILRLIEVLKCYFTSFGFSCFIPYILRYIKRILAISS